MTNGSGLNIEDFESSILDLDPQFGQEHPARISPLISGSGDRKLLSEWIDQQPEYETVQMDSESTALTTANFDLCILDQAALQTYVDELRDRKEATAPTLIPYLLLYPEQNPSIIETDRGELADSVLRETVDEIVSLPLKKSELAWRVEALLRLRSQSLQLNAETSQLRRFKRAADAAGHAIYITDSAGTIEYVNTAFERITGYSAEEAIGENPRVLKSGEMPESYYEELWETVHNGEMWVEEVINRRKNGEIYDAEQTIAPITGPEGEIIAYVAIQQDITERKRKQRKLLQYRQTVENSSDLLIAVNTDLEVLFANKKYCQYHDLDQSKVEGESLQEVLGRDTFAEIEDTVKAGLRGENPTKKIVRETAHRGERILEGNLFQLRDEEDEIRGVAASLRDVTDRELLQEDLRDSKEQYESLFNSIQDGIVVADTDRRITNCNSAFTDLFGYDVDEIAGEQTRSLYASEDEFQEMGNAIEGHMDDPTFTHTVEYETKSGQTFPGETSVFYLRNADNEIMGFIGVISDITERRDRIKQLQMVDRVLQHNFHNDLNVIQGFAENIEREGKPPVTTYGETIKKTSDSLLETVDTEREITKFLSDPPPTTMINVVQRCKTVVEAVSSTYPHAKISTNYYDEPTVETSVAIDQAIEELLTNSIIHANSNDPEISLTITASSDTVSIQVTDDNPVIHEMERKVLTGEKEPTPLYHGSGMGLWLVHLIVNHSGGSLEFDENGVGGNVVSIHYSR